MDGFEKILWIRKELLKYLKKCKKILNIFYNKKYKVFTGWLL